LEYSFFTDESYITDSRFRCLSCFSIPSKHILTVHKELELLLKESNVSEFKWTKLSNAKYRLCSLKLIDYVIENIVRLDIRIDVLTWDTQDDRHDIKGRDDNANFERMYFKILKSCIERRKTSSGVKVFYDQKQGVSWNNLEEILKQVGKRISEKSYPLFDEQDFFKNYTINEFREVDSEKCNATQIADLFGGLSVFSKDKFLEYSHWHKMQTMQTEIFSVEKTRKLTNREAARFPVLESLNRQAKEKKLGVSLNSKKRLHTFKGSNPINFWLYEPQSEYDKAPTTRNN